MFKSRRGKPLRLQQRHFEFIAKVLKKYGATSMISNFANELVDTNPNFKPEKFLRAAGYYGMGETLSIDETTVLPFHVLRAKHTAKAIASIGSKPKDAKDMDIVEYAVSVAADVKEAEEIKKAISELIASGHIVDSSKPKKLTIADALKEAILADGISDKVPF